MARRVAPCLFLLFVWCVVSGLLMTVTAEPTVNATILTPEADRKECGMVHMRCVATNLEENHIVEWRTENSTLRWGKETLAGHRRWFTFETIQTDGMTIQNFNISNLQIGDTDEYVCNVKDPIATGGSDILATDRVTLSVLYFPSQPPMCSPDGPIIVHTGKELNMHCSSEAGNSAVIMTVSRTPNNTSSNTNQYTWMQSNTDDTLLASINLMVDVADHNVSFECIIYSTHFPDMERSCTIGPIYVAASSTEPPTISTELTIGPTEPTTRPTTQERLPSASNTAIIAGASAGGAVALIVLVLILIVTCKRGLCNMEPKPDVSDTEPTQVHFSSATHHTDHSQANSYDNITATPNDHPSNDGNIYHDPTETTVTASPQPERNSHPGQSSVRQQAEGSTVPLYATHNKKATMVNEDDASRTNSDQASDISMEMYDNPIYDSQDPGGTSEPHEDGLDRSSRPVAVVTPNPETYKPKLQRASSNHYDSPTHQGDQMEKQETQPPATSSGPPTVEDIGLSSSSLGSGPVYAMVMKNGTK